MLDPIITTLSRYYQVPQCLDPLDADPQSKGKKSDHLIVLAKPINNLSTKSCRTTKSVIVRPLPVSGFLQMQEWFSSQTWDQIFQEPSAHSKAEIFQSMLLEACNKYFPEKTRKVTSDDQPWVTHRVKILDRRRKRIYHKERRSNKWRIANKLFKEEVKIAKKMFYTNMIADLKLKKPGQWYSALKRITAYDHLENRININDINHLSDQEQAEVIADYFTKIPNSYEPLKTEDIIIPPHNPDEVPQFSQSQVWLLLAKLPTNKATVSGDVHAKIIKHFAALLQSLSLT